MKCIICNNNLIRIYKKDFIDLNYFDKKNLLIKKINFLICKKCGLVSRNNIDKTILDRYYSSISAHSVEIDLHSNVKSFFRKRFKDIIKFLKISNKTKVLEIGCASGEFSSALINKGIKVYGIEPNKVSSNLAKKRGIKIIGGSLEQLSSDYLNYFDMVFSMGTLEHIIYPNKFVSSMVKFSKIEGLIYLDMPSTEMSVKKNIWGSNIILPHLHYFSSYNLHLLLMKNSIIPVYYNNNKEYNYSSQAIIGKKTNIFSKHKKDFLDLADFERQKHYKICMNIKKYLKLNNKNKNTNFKTIAFYGCGDDLFKIMDTKIKLSKKIEFLDGSKLKIGKKFLGKTILDPKKISQCDLIIISILDPKVSGDVLAIAKKLFPFTKIIPLSKFE